MAIKSGEFCGDIKAEIEQRTKDVLNDGSLGFAQKLGKLAQISSNRLSYVPSQQEGHLQLQARAGNFVAALVESPFVPMADAVFLGQVDKEKPITLDPNGVAILAVESGVLARVYTHDNGYNPRFGISARYDEELTSVGTDEFPIVTNQIIPATFKPSPMTPLADKVIAQLDGLDFKFVSEGINAPEVDESGAVNEERYDRLRLLRHFGREAYVGMVLHAREVVLKGPQNVGNIRLRATQYEG